MNGFVTVDVVDIVKSTSISGNSSCGTEGREGDVSGDGAYQDKMLGRGVLLGGLN